MGLFLHYFLPGQRQLEVGLEVNCHKPFDLLLHRWEPFQLFFSKLRMRSYTQGTFPRSTPSALHGSQLVNFTASHAHLEGSPTSSKLHCICVPSQLWPGISTLVFRCVAYTNFCFIRALVTKPHGFWVCLNSISPMKPIIFSVRFLWTVRFSWNAIAIWKNVYDSL